MTEMKITFVGGGNMAAALAGGLMRQGIPAAAIRVVEIVPEARRRWENLGVAAFSGLAEGLAADACVVLAVKPQQLRDVARKLAPLLREQLVISIAAGVRTEDLSRWLGGYRRIVRVMPNTPALVSRGVSGLFALPGAGPEERRMAERILEAVGAVLWLQDEEQMDAVTAISGSGPAYVFYFLEALAQAGAQLGLDQAMARQLALDTLTGAAELARQSPDSFATLRANVTSKGGTTERALAELDQGGVQAWIIRAARAAALRSREMGDALGAD